MSIDTRTFSLKTGLVSICIGVLCALPCAWAAEEGEDSVERDYSEELPRIPAIEPVDALGSFEILPGYRMDLVAAEPSVYDPVAMSFDENGRLYVVEMRGYSEEMDAHISSIRLLEDTDNDGRFDKSTVFLDGLEWPTAILCYDGGVFIGMPPDILFCKDTDGDGAADARETVFTGFSLANVQGLLNTFLWGLDNRIHGATSSSGAEVVRVTDGPAGRTLTLRSRDFSFDPRSREMRPESGGAQHGMSFDDWGRKFVCSNSDHIQLTLFEDRYVARNPYLAAPGPRQSIAVDGPSADVFRISPVEPWRIVRTRLRVKGIVPGPVEGGGTAAGYFTSATGVTIYRGDAMPELRGMAFIADVGSNLIHRKRIEPDGVSLTAHRIDEKKEFIASKDIWFRPVQFVNGPDGALYVLDMYREVIEHPLSLAPVIKKHLDLNSGNDRGRIYRIVPENFAQPAPIRLGEMSSLELAALLDHPNAWHRETAARLLYQRQDTSVQRALEKLVAQSENQEGRVQALYLLDSLEVLETETLLAVLVDADARVRRHAVRLAEGMADNVNVREKLEGMAGDPDLMVQYQLTYSLGALPAEIRGPALTAILKQHADDSWFRLAAMSSLSDGAGIVYAALAEDGTFHATQEGREFLGTLAGQVGSTGNNTEIEAVLASADAMPETEAALAQAVVSGMLAGLKRGGRTALIQPHLDKSARAAQIVNDILASAKRTALDTDAKPADRADAIPSIAMAGFEDSLPLLEGMLKQQEPLEVQSAALNTLRTFDRPEVPEVILAHWEEFSPQMRSRAVEALFSRKDWLDRMLDAIEAKSFSVQNLDSTRVQMAKMYPDADIQARAKKLLTGSQARRQEVVEAYQDALQLAGDKTRGKALFAESCAQCHRLEGVGYEVGPDLSNMGNSGADKVLANVLDPNREINPQYVNYVVETKDWESYSGVIGSETATGITLKRANGEEDTILRVNIESITSAQLSIMPEGWEETLDKQAVADLIAYIMSLTEL